MDVDSIKKGRHDIKRVNAQGEFAEGASSNSGHGDLLVLRCKVCDGEAVIRGR